MLNPHDDPQTAAEMMAADLEAELAVQSNDGDNDVS